MCLGMVEGMPQASCALLAPRSEGSETRGQDKMCELHPWLLGNWKKEGREAAGTPGTGSGAQRGMQTTAQGRPSARGPAHLYQAPDVGYVRRAVAHSFIFLHLQNTKTFLRVRAGPSLRTATLGDSKEPVIPAGSSEPAAGGARLLPQWGAQAQQNPRVPNPRDGLVLPLVEYPSNPQWAGKGDTLVRLGDRSACHRPTA